LFPGSELEFWWKSESIEKERTKKEGEKERKKERKKCAVTTDFLRFQH